MEGHYSSIKFRFPLSSFLDKDFRRCYQQVAAEGRVLFPSLWPQTAFFRGKALAKELSVVIPIYNEEENIIPLYRALKRVLDGLSMDYEIVYVDDGSRDKSFELLREISEKDDRVVVIKHKENRGESAAFYTGFQFARGSIIVSMDGDYQNDPEDIPRLLKELEKCDVVCGYRRRRHDSFSKRVSSKIANFIRRLFTGDTTKDVGCSLRAYRAKFIKKVKLFKGMHRFIPTLVALEGARIREIPVNHLPRLRGKSKYGILDRAIASFIDLLAVMWMIKRHPRIKVERVIDGGKEVSWEP